MLNEFYKKLENNIREDKNNENLTNILKDKKKMKIPQNLSSDPQQKRNILVEDFLKFQVFNFIKEINIFF